MEEPIFEAAGMEFKRCPVTFRVAGAHQLHRTFREGALDASFETRMSWSPKKLAALFYLKYLDELKEANNGH